MARVPIPGPLRTLGRNVRAVRRRLSSQEAVWNRALPSEVAFWRDWIATRGGDVPDEFRSRFDPDQPLQEPLILEVLERMEAPLVRLLDVGAGPVTWLGKTHPDKRVEITAVDPLADDYNRLLDDAGLEPPVRTATAHGEALREAFAAGSFDIAYARNALDHTFDPAQVIKQMVDVVRPGGYVILRHWQNEAEILHYGGLHQWNFGVSDGRLVIWNERRRIDMNSELAGSAEVVARTTPGGGHSPWVEAVIQRLPGANVDI